MASSIARKPALDPRQSERLAQRENFITWFLLSARSLLAHSAAARKARNTGARR
jgi:hypothetical protein